MLKLKAKSFYTARYPAHTTAQITLHVTPWQICSFEHQLLWEAFSHAVITELHISTNVYSHIGGCRGCPSGARMQGVSIRCPDPGGVHQVPESRGCPSDARIQGVSIRCPDTPLYFGQILLHQVRINSQDTTRTHAPACLPQMRTFLTYSLQMCHIATTIVLQSFLIALSSLPCLILIVLIINRK